MEKAYTAKHMGRNDSSKTARSDTVQYPTKGQARWFDINKIVHHSKTHVV